eukprot:350808-Chlamydomonas_euryale.AAC.7
MADFHFEPDATVSSAHATASAPPLSAFDSQCYMYQRPGAEGGKPRYYPLASGGIARVLGCELLYGPADCHFGFGPPNDGLTMDDGDVSAVTPCGVNWPSPDRLVPSRAAAHLWGWADGHPSANPASGAPTPPERGCAFASAYDGRWRAAPCDDGGAAPGASVLACRAVDGAPPVGRHAVAPTADVLWKLPALSGQCPQGTSPDVPHTAFENLLLQQAMTAAGAVQARLPLAPPSWRPQWLGSA